MLTLMLLCSLSASPRVSLLGDSPRFSVRLVDDPAPVAPDYKSWPPDQLRRESLRLEDSRPSMAMPITLMVTGGVVFIVGAYIGLIALFSSAIGGSSGSLPILCAVLMLGGLGLLLTGVVVLVGILRDRSEINTQLEQIDRVLNGGRLPGDQDLPPVRPPPPPPAQGGPLQVFGPMAAPAPVLARF